MAQLLHQLLYDLRQRCCHLLAELGQLSPTLAAEAVQYRDQMAARLARTGTLIEAMLADPGLQDPLLVRNYFHDYKRLSEQMHYVEAGPVLALKHFGKDDLAMTRVVARVCQEINFPYRAPLCATLSAHYYWALPRMDLIFVPCGEPFHLLALADLYHELAHFLLERDLRQLVRPLLRLIDKFFNRMVKEARQKGWPAESVARFDERRRQWKRYWYAEFAADMLAAYWAGPAFGWSNLRLCTNLGVELFEGVDSHPADAARHAGVRSMLLQTGHGAAAAQIDVRWAELVALTGQQPPTEYDLVYPPELLDQMATLLCSSARNMGLAAWCGPVAAAGPHVTNLLNAAWDQFHASPDAFAAYEHTELTGLRQGLGLPPG
ncbi:MAG: hypothetical protein JNM56_36215 [Planctomycetia bacterium]|nr:hypothetical protein [Planctomycetia bacterium]